MSTIDEYMANINAGKKSDPWHDYGRSLLYADVVRAMIDDLQYMGSILFRHAFVNEPAEIHRQYADIATNLSIRFPVIETFRGSAKSTYFAAFLPMWHLYCEPFKRAGIYPKTRDETIALLSEQTAQFVVVLSKSSDLAKQRIRTIKRIHGALKANNTGVLEGRRQLIAHFGMPNVGKNTSDELHLHRGIFKSLGGSQPGHGLAEEFVRITLGVVDDPEIEDNTKTEKATSDNYSAIINGIHNGLTPEGRMPVLATPIRQHSFVRRCKKLCEAKAPGWHYFHHPLIVDNDGLPPKRIPSLAEYDAEEVKSVRSVWEDRLPIRNELKDLDAKRRAGQAHPWYLSRQCQIRADEQTKLFREDDIMLYDGRYFKQSNKWFLEITHLGPYTEFSQGSPYKLDEPQIVAVNLYTGHDPSFGVRRDDAVKLTRAFDSANERHFIHSVLARNDRTIYDQCLWLLKGSDEFGILGYDELNETAIIVEGKFFRESMEQQLKELAEELKISWVPIVHDTPTLRKADKYRASAIVKDFRNRRVFFKRSHVDVISVFTNFDASIDAQPDDAIDAYYLSRLRNYPALHDNDGTVTKRKPSKPTIREINAWRLPRRYA